MKFNFKDIETPKAGLQIYTDSWWLCENGDAKRALFYGDSPQCNKNRRICEITIKGSMYRDMDLQIIYIAFAYVPIRY